MKSPNQKADKLWAFFLSHQKKLALDKALKLAGFTIFLVYTCHILVT
jgi:hypothetical protein